MSSSPAHEIMVELLPRNLAQNPPTTMDAALDALEAGRYDEIDVAFRTGQLDANTASTLLQLSVANNWAETVEILLRHGVDPTSISILQLSKCHLLEIFTLLEQHQWPFKQDGHLIIP